MTNVPLSFMATLSGSGFGSPFHCALTSPLSIAISAGPLPVGGRCVVAVQQLMDTFGWSDVGGISGDGDGATLRGISVVHPRRGAAYRIRHEIEGGPVRVIVVAWQD